MENLNEQTGLMDIHQAARILQVSEVSVRRYTNSGALTCIRIGGRKERRFRREDLEAFLGAKLSDGPATAAIPDLAALQKQEASSGAILMDGMEIPVSSHLCQLFETDRGRLQMAVPFLADGLAAGDACFLVASKSARAKLLDALGRSRKTLQNEIDDGQLRLIACQGNGKMMLAALDDAFGAAMENGYERLRLVGDMAWIRDYGMSADELVDFETRYDLQIGHSYPIVSLCLYDARRFSGVEILHALKSHSDTFELPLSRFLLR
jgi:excisionase family DNA binding protein